MSQFKPLVLALSLGFGSLFVNGPIAHAAQTTWTATASVEGITEYSLPNGLRVLLAPDASKPTTTVNITYLVGSRHESYGETGMAHLLEHMLFKGTKTSGNILSELSRRGMQFNGTTSYDRTNYFETFPASADNLEWALKMEADRMINSKIAKSDLDTEFSVVRNELERGENDPIGVMIKQLSAVTFDWHNYGHETIGARSDVEGVKIENLQAFYRKFYQPDNAVLIVAGKFDVKATQALIEKHFAKLQKPKRTLQSTWTREPERDGTREITVRRVADQQIAMAMYPIAASAHDDSTVIAVLTELLAATPNGRLHKELVEKKLAVSTLAYPAQLAEPGFALFGAILSKDQDLAAAKKVLIETIENLAQKPVGADELSIAKTSLLNAIEKTVNNPEQLSVALSESIAAGDWRLFFTQRDLIEKITPEDIQRVAANYFKEDSRSYGQFLPITKANRTVIPATPDVKKLVADYKGRAAVSAGETFDPSPANIDKRTQLAQLANGARVALLSKKNRGETVNGSITLRFGDLASLRGKAATPDLTADLLLRGTQTINRADLAAKLAKLKTNLMINGKGQNLVVNFDTDRKNLDGALKLIQEILRTPAFNANEFDLLVKENLAAIEAAENDPQAKAGQLISEQKNEGYQADDVRYAPSFAESQKAYAAAKLDDVKAFYKQFYGANNASISLVGDFDANEVKAKLNELFGDWNSAVRFERVSSLSKELKGGVVTAVTPDKANAVYLANITFQLNDTAADYPALRVANQVLGGGLKSRFFNRLRQKEGISYGAGSFLQVPSLDNQAYLGFYAIFAPQNLDRLKVAFREEVEAFIKSGITAEELTEAKQALDQETQVGLAQDANLSGILNANLIRNRTLQYQADLQRKTAALTLEQVNAAIRKYLSADKIFHAYVGDFKGDAK